MKIKFFISSLLRGFGQIMLQDNWITGLLFIVAIFYDSTMMGIAAVVSNIVGMLTAKLVKYSDEEIGSGLYGFNASLVGVALIFYFQPNVWVWVAIVLGSALSTLFMGWAIKNKIPVYTFPFVAITFATIYILGIPELAAKAINPPLLEVQDMGGLLIEAHAFGQVIFQGTLLAGLLFFIGVFIGSPIGALYALFAVGISTYIASHGHQAPELIGNGIFGFNVVLCGIALAGNKIKDAVFVIISVIFAFYLDIYLVNGGWTVLTFPFVAAMWFTLPIRALWNKIESNYFPANSDL